MQQLPAISPGDMVVIAAGGPVMTVQACSLNLAYCSWIESGEVRHGTFAVESLRMPPVCAAATMFDGSAQAPEDACPVGVVRPESAGIQVAAARAATPEAP